MKKWSLLSLFLLATVAGHAIDDWEWVGQLKNVSCVVKKFADGTFLLYNMADDSKRFMPVNMPDELKKEGLELCVIAQVGKIPPNARLIGTPVKLQKVKVLHGGKKKFGLKKSKYKF